jgi:hypothetical protein
MSQPVRKVLDLLINKGLVNWDKLSAKLHAALNTVDNDFKKIRNVTNPKEQSPLNLEDAITFSIDFQNKSYSYKLYHLRFRNGILECSGFQSGHGKTPNILWVGNKVEF